VLTIRTELTDRILIFGERHLRRVLGTYAAPYNIQRPHRALQLRPPRPESTVPEPVYGRIRRRAVLGGLIKPVRIRSLKPLIIDYGRVMEPDRPGDAGCRRTRISISVAVSDRACSTIQLSSFANVW
jgi:hypothetical protein